MNFIIKAALGLLNIFHVKRYNKYYWNIRAKDIDEKWGQSTGDYDLIRRIILEIKPKEILDVGCGSGRLFPLYDELKIPKVVAQDISPNAIELAKQKSIYLHNINIGYVNEQIYQLNYPESFFDLVISNRALSAVFPEDIAKTIKVLCKISKSIYLNEITDSDYHPSPYFFKHDYKKLMQVNNYQMIWNEIIPDTSQQWYLFSKCSDH